MRANAEQSTNTGPYEREEAPSVVLDLSDTALAEEGNRAPIYAVAPPRDNDTQGLVTEER